MKLVPAAITTKLGRKTLLLQKQSPQVLFGVGVAGVLTGSVLACRATLRMDSVLDEAAARMDKVKANNYEAMNMGENDRKHDLSLVRFQTGVRIIRLYTPAIVFTGVGIAALTQSHRILNQRNAALTAAYTTLDEAFKRYRERVIEKYGEDQDRDFRFQTEQVEVGKGKSKELVTRVGSENDSVYSRFFDQLSPSWSPDPEVNLLFLKCQQDYANELLRARGHVFLNEIYDRLGIPRSKAGSVVGWVLSNDGSTDNYISFGVFEGNNERSRDFVNGREGSVLCDFNVDGLIYHLIEDMGEDLSWQLGR